MTKIVPSGTYRGQPIEAQAPIAPFLGARQDRPVPAFQAMPHRFTRPRALVPRTRANAAPGSLPEALATPLGHDSASGATPKPARAGGAARDGKPP